MSIDTLTADTSINRASPQVAKKNWETPIPNGIQENEVPDTGTVDMDFWDFVDIVNPLQHIPVVNTIYRELTGDTIKGVSRVIGGGLYGGVIGLVAGIGSAIVAETTGKDPGEHVLAMLTGSDDETPAPAGNTAIAEATPPTAAPAAEAAPAPASPPSASAQPHPGPGLHQHRHGRARRRRRDPDARRSCRGPGAAPAGRAGSAELPGAQAHGGPPAQAGADGRDRAGRQYRQDAGPARRRPTGVGAGKRETDRIAGAAAAGRGADSRAGHRDQTAAWPPGGSAKVPPELVADMMMNALDKYKQGARTGTASMANGAGAARGAY